MAISNESNGMVMPVSPMYGGGYGNNGGFGMNGDWAWIILLLLLAGNGGWGMGGGFGGGGFAADGAMLYPWMNQAEITTQGFQNSALSGQLNSIQSGVQNLSTQLCNCCGDMQMSLANGFAGVEQGANARQMASMQQNFALQSALQNCCCENRESIADLKYTVATENCADRAAISDGIRDVIASQTASTQRILDQLCQDKIDAKNDEIAQLRSQLTAANLAASQIAQTSQIVDQTYNRLSSCPVGTVPVFGNQPIWTCASNVASNNCGCGCGCGA